MVKNQVKSARIRPDQSAECLLFPPKADVEMNDLDSVRMAAFGCDLNGSTQHSNETQNTACMLMNLKETSSSHSSRESGVTGPLEASRGAEVEWASIWRTLNRLFITCRPRRAGSKPQKRGVTQVLRRPVESAAESRRSLTLFSGDFGPGTGRSDDIFLG